MAYIFYRSHDVAKRHPWFRIKYTPKGGPNAGDSRPWRGPVSEYLDSRITNPRFRERLVGLPSRTVLNEKELERFVAPLAYQDWVSFREGHGPDPRKPIPRDGTVMTAGELLDLWYTTTKEHDEGFASIKNVRQKLARCKSHWYDKDEDGNPRPASDLMNAAVHEGFVTSILKGGAKKSTAANYLRSVIRPAVYWAVNRTPDPLLTGPIPFGRHRMQLSNGDERDRVVTFEEEAKILGALTELDAEGRRYAKLLREFITCMVDLGTRPFELACLQVRDIEFDASQIRFPVDKTKKKRERIVPYNPAGRVAKIFERFRFLSQSQPDAYIFAPEGGWVVEGLDFSRKLTLREYRVLGDYFTNSLTRPTWIAAVLRASGAEAKKKGKAGWPLRAKQVYKDTNIVVRDFRRTCATRWDDVGLPWHRRVYLLGHAAAGQTSKYSLQEVKALRADLARFVWAAEDARLLSAVR